MKFLILLSCLAVADEMSVVELCYDPTNIPASMKCVDSIHNILNDSIRAHQDSVESKVLMDLLDEYGIEH